MSLKSLLLSLAISLLTVLALLRLTVKLERWAELRSIHRAYVARRRMHEAEVDEERKSARALALKGHFPRPEVAWIPEPEPAQSKPRSDPIDRHLLTNLPLYTSANASRGLSVYVPELNCALSPGSPLLGVNRACYGKLWGPAVRAEIAHLGPRPRTKAHDLLMKVREEARERPCVKARREGCPPISRFPEHR